jgi:hypothetical protein
MPQIAKPPDAREPLGGEGDRTFWTPLYVSIGTKKFVRNLEIAH